jgi:hypothetical protein
MEGRMEVMEKRERKLRIYWMTVRKREDTGN